MNKKELKINEKSQNKKSTKACSTLTSHFSSLTSKTGITLIALVITIIVMLILVGVTVTIAIKGGLFNTAKRAVSKTEKAKDSELRLIAMANAATHDKKWEYTLNDENKTTIPIPAGFAPTEIEGENTVEEGLVIIDAEGNEFVWIPCGENDTVKYSEVYSNGKSGEYWKKKGYNSQQYYYYWAGAGVGTEEPKWAWQDKDGNVDSVETYGGFYIARYEAGLPEEYWEGNTYKWDVPSVSEDKSGQPGKRVNNLSSYKPVSKKNNPSWNGIDQADAKTVSENMYADNSSVKSQLIDSYAWDTVVEWISNGTRAVATNSTDYGNYKNSTITVNGLYINYGEETTHETYQNGSLKTTDRTQSDAQPYYEIATGSSENTKMKNIYDLAGNMSEWTTEVGHRSSDGDYAVMRGGTMKQNGTSHPVCHRQTGAVTNCTWFDIGFRVVLYLK